MSCVIAARAARIEVFSFALLLACARRRVYDRSMVRKCATFAFGLALIAVLGFAGAHAHALKIPGASIDFSAPCEPASPAFKASSESKAVSTIDSTHATVSAEGPACVVGRYCGRNGRAGDCAPGAPGLSSSVPATSASKLLIGHRKNSRSRRVRERPRSPVLQIWSLIP